MRPHIRAFLELCAEILSFSDPVVEIGSKLVAGQEKMADLRPLLPGCQFIGCDMEPGKGVDRIEDLRGLTFGDGEVGTFILADTFEHVQDPIQATKELHRCLDKRNGLLLATSVMHFPIHAFPNDYWRYTPEAFRSLFAQFGFVSVFFAGDSTWPHSVCVVAGFGADLASRLVAEYEAPSSPSDPRGGLEVPFAQSGWILTPGMWIKGWMGPSEYVSVEIRVDGRPIQQAELNLLRPDVDQAVGFPPGTARGFQTQMQSMGSGQEVIGRAELWGIDVTGKAFLEAIAPPGVVLPQAVLEPGFVLHCFDEKGGPFTAREHGERLVAEIQQRGEPVKVDLGCGFRKQGNIGIDCTQENTQADLICMLGFEPIPLNESSVDEITARDFLEHLPKAVYLEREKRMHYPIIHLMNEIWRVLKPGGTFISLTPCYPHDEVHQDPTHLSVWTLNSMPYFCGKYPVAKIYGVEAQFTLEESHLAGFYLYAKLRK